MKLSLNNKIYINCKMNNLILILFMIFLTTCTTQTLQDQTFTGFHQSEIKELLGEPVFVKA